MARNGRRCTHLYSVHPPFFRSSVESCTGRSLSNLFFEVRGSNFLGVSGILLPFVDGEKTVRSLFLSFPFRVLYPTSVEERSISPLVYF